MIRVFSTDWNRDSLLMYELANFFFVMVLWLRSTFELMKLRHQSSETRSYHMAHATQHRGHVHGPSSISI